MTKPVPQKGSTMLELRRTRLRTHSKAISPSTTPRPMRYASRNVICSSPFVARTLYGAVFSGLYGHETCGTRADVRANERSHFGNHRLSAIGKQVRGLLAEKLRLLGSMGVNQGQPAQRAPARSGAPGAATDAPFRVRTRSMSNSPACILRIGLICSTEPRLDWKRLRRPLRRRYSSVSRAAMQWVRDAWSSRADDDVAQ